MSDLSNVVGHTKDRLSSEDGSPETIRILHKCQVLIDKSVQRVTVWHHRPSDANL